MTRLDLSEDLLKLAIPLSLESQQLLQYPNTFSFALFLFLFTNVPLNSLSLDIVSMCLLLRIKTVHRSALLFFVGSRKVCLALQGADDLFML